jgi:D-alanyl-D-alanine carboxypeptidase
MHPLAARFRASYKWVLLAAVLLLFAGFVYQFTLLRSIRASLQSTQSDLASTTVLLEERSTALYENFLAEQQRSETVREALSEAQDDIKRIERRFGNVSDTVEELEKLTRADPKLLQKYSKVFFLNEHYEPERLVEVPTDYAYHENRLERVHAGIWPFLRKLIDDAKQAGIELYVKSAYRSFDEQEQLKNAYTVTYGAGTANQFSADQGYSEHQLGTTVDFITTGLNGQLAGFGNTPAYTWLIENAHEYGFILSYPPNNAYYVYEPWHWRFVGEDLADELHDESKYFYDLDQREIDEYLPNMFD